MVGGLLVAVAAVGMFAASSRSGAGPRRSYVVATHALAAGARLQSSDLQLVPMDLGAALRTHAFESPQPLLGTTLVVPLGSGELVQASAVVARKGDAASREMSFTLERGQVSPGVKEGERADLLANWNTGSDAFTSVVVRQALIVAIERPRTSSGDTGPATVTVSVDDPNDVLALASAVQLAKITLVRATGAPPLPPVTPTYRVGRT
ncbi:MAG: SAF domain-containing protein [Actinomycetota bacterium]|nr:SAF domain-containing protein [Actinomycetota bacterium]